MSSEITILTSVKIIINNLLIAICCPQRFREPSSEIWDFLFSSLSPQMVHNPISFPLFCVDKKQFHFALSVKQWRREVYDAEMCFRALFIISPSLPKNFLSTSSELFLNTELHLQIMWYRFMIQWNWDRGIVSTQDIHEAYSFTSAEDVLYWQIYYTHILAWDDQTRVIGGA